MVTLKVPNENGPDVIMVLVVGTIAMSMFLGFLLAGWRAGGHHDRNCLFIVLNHIFIIVFFNMVVIMSQRIEVNLLQPSGTVFPIIIILIQQQDTILILCLSWIYSRIRL